jgi:hypothetical protein
LWLASNDDADEQSCDGSGRWGNDSARKSERKRSKSTAKEKFQKETGLIKNMTKKYIYISYIFFLSFPSFSFFLSTSLAPEHFSQSFLVSVSSTSSVSLMITTTRQQQKYINKKEQKQKMDFGLGE